MATSERIASRQRPRAEPRYRKVPEVALRDRAFSRYVAAASWRAVQEKGETIRRALELSNRGRVSELKSAVHDSHLSRSIEDAIRLERHAVDSTFMPVAMLSASLLPELEKLTTPELESLLDRIYYAETKANEALNLAQMARKCGSPLQGDDEAALWAEQASISVRGLAVRNILNERAARGR